MDNQFHGALHAHRLAHVEFCLSSIPKSHALRERAEEIARMLHSYRPTTSTMTRAAKDLAVELNFIRLKTPRAVIWD